VGWKARCVQESPVTLNPAFAPPGASIRGITAQRFAAAIILLTVVARKMTLGV